jgi:excisionase family DNA binding protein
MTAAEPRSWAAIRALDGDPLVTPAEVADIMRVKPRTVTLWAREGGLPSLVTPGGHRRFRRSAVAALFARDVP